MGAGFRAAGLVPSASAANAFGVEIMLSPQPPALDQKIKPWETIGLAQIRKKPATYCKSLGNIVHVAFIQNILAIHNPW